MERDSVVHGGMHQPLSLYKSHYICSNTNPIFLPTPYYSPSNSKGLLKAPPLSLLQPPPLPRRSSSCPAPAPKRKHQKKSTTSYSTSKNNNTTIPKKEEKKTPPKLRPETAALPRNIARVDNPMKENVIKDRVDMLLGSVVFTISPPPPSSLPLPTFSLRPKLTCNAAATDDLRRLLRLQ